MKKSKLMMLLLILTVLTLFMGCGAPARETEPQSVTEVQITVVPDNHLEEDEYDPKIFGIDDIVPQLEIPDESVPLSPVYLDLSDGASEREAEALAIYHAGLRNEDVSYLHSRYEEDVDVPYYHVEFRSQEAPYKVWIQASNGAVILYEKG